MRELPLHQKLIICVLYCAKLNDREIVAAEVGWPYFYASVVTELLITQLLKKYQRMCSHCKFTPMSSEFFSLLDSLSCSGYIGITEKKKGEKRDAKVRAT